MQTSKYLSFAAFLLNFLLAIYFFVHFYTLGQIVLNYKSSYGFYYLVAVQVFFGLASLGYYFYLVKKQKTGINPKNKILIAIALLVLAPVVFLMLHNFLINTYFAI